MPRRLKAPTYCCYRQKYARTVIDRKSYHLGIYGSEESRQRFRELVAAWSAGMPTSQESVDPQVETVAEVLEAYRAFAQRYYGDVPRGRYRNLLPVLRVVRELYADLPAIKFTPKKLKLVRQAFVNRGLARGVVNRYTHQVVDVFAWAAEEEMVPGSLVHSLRQVKNLRYGHTDAPEGKPVHSVPQTTVDATLPHLTPVVADMVRLQLVSGCRPGELCSLTPSQIDRSDDVWLYRPLQHKTAHRGHERVVALGPRLKTFCGSTYCDQQMLRASHPGKRWPSTLISDTRSGPHR